MRPAINYGLMVLLLRNTYPRAERGGPGGGASALERVVKIHRKSIADYVNGTVPTHKSAARLRRVARQRLSAAQCRQCGLVIESEPGDPVGVSLAGGIPIDLDWVLLVELLAEKYPHDWGISRATGIRCDLLATYERGRNPNLPNGLLIINEAVKMLTQREFNQCRRSFHAQTVAA